MAVLIFFGSTNTTVTVAGSEALAAAATASEPPGSSSQLLLRAIRSRGRNLRRARQGPPPSAARLDTLGTEPAVLFPVRRYHAANREPCQSTGATGLRCNSLPPATQIRAAPNTHSGLRGRGASPSGTQGQTPRCAN